MRVGRVKIDNFKSLLGFDLQLAKFSCLIGLNGSGKSTVLQCLDFLGRLVRGDIAGWLNQREWKPSDVTSRLSGRRVIDFTVEVLTDKGKHYATWTGSYNYWLMHCTTESVKMSGAKLTVSSGDIVIATRADSEWAEERSKVQFRYEGSILSQFRDESLPEDIKKLRDFLRSIHSLDMLTPAYLRQRTRQAGGTLGLGGQQLSSFLRELPVRDRLQLVQDLRQVYPRLSKVISKSLRGGWKQVEAYEEFDSGMLRTEARHLNDGLLRLIAVLAELTTKHDVAMFDEIENGINPELIDFLVTKLVKAQQQVVVTTHSPLVLNYLEDKVAEEGVVYIYKTAYGQSRAIPFFAIPSIKEKLGSMGPGETFSDTNLHGLEKEIARLHRKESD